MIQRAQVAAEEKGVSHNMQFVQSAAQDITQYLEQPLDLILFHAFLEWIAEPKYVLQILSNALNNRGAISLMFFNANWLVMRNAVLGNFQLAIPGVKRRWQRSLSSKYPLDPPVVYGWLEQMGLFIIGKTVG